MYSIVFNPCALDNDIPKLVMIIGYIITVKPIFHILYVTSHDYVLYICILIYICMYIIILYACMCARACARRLIFPERIYGN